MTREICKACGRVNPLGFAVPDGIWNIATDHFQFALCIMCFAQRADDAGVRWELGIEFFPVSLVSHQDATG